jgi:mono/diheme cytochrome c family protein
MNRLLFCSITMLFCAVMTLTLSGQTTTPAADATLARGKYLVEEVARCQECHAPKVASGEFDKAQWLKGTTLVYAPSAPIAGWHQKSPDITSTSGLWKRWGGVDGFAKFLETAKTPTGGKAGPPMPAYTVKAEDAAAMAAYLQSLP